ncbi:MAG: hypothetical protein MZV65_47985 [Chromatiales bacterium]|nr:hypothetical protein [Chromatiales bacterium]
MGGTRNCDWWFTDEAVLLDTAGRYTTQESNREADARRLERLPRAAARSTGRAGRSTASSSPSSVLDLLQQSPDERERHAAALRARIQELHEQLGHPLPDLRAGHQVRPAGRLHASSSASYGKEERAQVWGITFPLRDPREPGDPLASFAGRVRRAGAAPQRPAGRPHAGRSATRTSAPLIYGFPQQFGSAQGPARRLPRQRVRRPRASTRRRCCAACISPAAPRKAAPIDRVHGCAGARASAWSAASCRPRRSSGRSYFLHAAAEGRGVRRAGARPAPTSSWERQRALLKWGGYAADRRWSPSA